MWVLQFSKCVCLMGGAGLGRHAREVPTLIPAQLERVGRVEALERRVEFRTAEAHVASDVPVLTRAFARVHQTEAAAGGVGSEFGGDTLREWAHRAWGGAHLCPSSCIW